MQKLKFFLPCLPDLTFGLLCRIGFHQKQFDSGIQHETFVVAVQTLRKQFAENKIIYI